MWQPLKKTNNLCANRETDNIVCSSNMPVHGPVLPELPCLPPTLFLSMTLLWWQLLTHNRLGRTVRYNLCQLPFSKKLDSINTYPLPKKITAITLYHNSVLPNTVPPFGKRLCNCISF